MKPTKGEIQCNYTKQIAFYVFINIESNKLHNHKPLSIAVQNCCTILKGKV